MTSWFRSWHGAPTDTKWLTIARRAGVAPGIVSAVAWALLDYASQHFDRGCVDGFDVETYAAFSGFEEADIQAVIDAMTSKQMIVSGRLASWEKRQPEREDNSAERVRRYRESRNGTGVTPDDVTQCNAETRIVTRGNAPDTDTDTDTDTEEVLTAYAVSAPAEQPAPVADEKKPKTPKSKPDTTPLLFDPVQDAILIEALVAHYESLGRRPPAKFQNVAQRDGYRLSAQFLGPDKTRRAVAQCIIGNRYALGDIVTSLLRWVDNEKRGGARPAQQTNEPKGFAAIREYMTKHGMVPNGVT